MSIQLNLYERAGRIGSPKRQDWPIWVSCRHSHRISISFKSSRSLRAPYPNCRANTGNSWSRTEVRAYLSNNSSRRTSPLMSTLATLPPETTAELPINLLPISIPYPPLMRAVPSSPPATAQSDPPSQSPSAALPCPPLQAPTWLDSQPPSAAPYASCGQTLQSSTDHQ